MLSMNSIDGSDFMKHEWQERLYSADDDELRRGYLREDNACLFCDEKFGSALLLSLIHILRRVRDALPLRFEAL